MGLACKTLLVLTMLLTGQDSGTTAAKPENYIPLSHVKPGMSGYGITAIEANHIKRFDVKVISVFKNFGAKRDVILVRCSGLNLEDSGIVAGMSGSPVYLLDGKNYRLAGAIAYGWTFCKSPLAGVQPIEQMLPVANRAAVDAEGQPAGPSAAVMDLRGKALTWAYGNRPSRRTAPPVEHQATLRPLATPLMVCGASPRVLATLRDRLAGTGLVPIASGQAVGGAADSAKPSKLQPGSVLAVPLVTGDLDISAVGTVTDVLGDTILAFGHPFLGSGRSTLPLASGYVHTIVPSYNRSFKLASAGKICGTLTADEATGVAGKLGNTPQMIPMSVTVTGGNGEQEKFAFRIAQHKRFTPLMAEICLEQALLAHSELPEQHWLQYRLTLGFADREPLVLSNVSSGAGVYEIDADLRYPIVLMYRNPFAKMPLRRAEAEVRIVPRQRTAEIERARLHRELLKPGEQVLVYVTLKPYRGKSVEQTLRLTLPERLPQGVYELMVGGADALLAQLQRDEPQLFIQRSLEDLLRYIKRIGSIRRDRLYLRLRLNEPGLQVMGQDLPKLPPSRLAVFGEPTGRVVPFVSAITVSTKTDYVVSGSRSFRITVSKRADQ